MRNLTKVSFLLLGTLVSTSASAGTKVGSFDIGTDMALTSNYVWRGVSQSDKHAAVQGGITVTHESGPYVGIWASSVDFDDNSQASMEVDLTAGIAHEYSFGLSLDLGIIHYDYPGAMGSLEYDFNEVYLGASYKTHGVGLSAKFSYSDDFFGTAATTPPNDKSAYYAEAGISYDLPQDILIAAHYGHTDGSHFNTNVTGRPDNYDDYSVGVSKELLGFGMDLSFYGTDRAGRTLNGDNADERVVFSLSKSF